LTTEHYLDKRYNCKMVSSLHLNNKNLMEIPPDIFMFCNLIELDISNNQLTKITRLLSKLIKLKKIDMHSNNLKFLPDFLWNLPELEEIIIDGNLLPCIPEGMKSDHTLIESIRSLLIAGKNKLPRSNVDIKKELGILRLNIKENKVSMIS